MEAREGNMADGGDGRLLWIMELLLDSRGKDGAWVWCFRAFLSYETYGNGEDNEIT